ncbi:DE-cadherin [Cylas formicarius]|uniref:DE-cadherin n=1 Tax=Cylas formicarius TaxID=197179 RepID=UPI00295857C9|nr:DE-cadherin [Cylas formicarius]XP_060537348.1 DE-cadherin [Cylas formicarius]
MVHWKIMWCTILLYSSGISNAQLTTTSNRVDFDNSIDSFPVSLPVRQQNQKLTTDSNRKPMFTECDNYKPSVKEEQEKGTFVIKVKAEDGDPPNAGGTVLYKIVKRDGGRDYFTIDNTTGEVRTNMPFDRDEPFRQKELYLTVQATDNGRPALSDICSFKVTVLDINDNAPQLDSQEYITQVAEDLKPNSEVMRIFAYDLDDGQNSKLTYSSRTEKGDFNDYFRIDPNTGVVYLLQSLATKKDTKFKTTVIVSDNGQVPYKTEANVSIIVVSSAKQPPRITKRYPEGDIILKENFNNYLERLVTIEAESSINDQEVIFELIKGKTLQTNKDQSFVLTPFENDTTKAFISLVRQLDYETVTEYTLTVRVKNKDSMDTSINIPIKIEDVNDEIPSFIELIKGSVVENDEAGAQAMVVRAIDKDGTSANNIVSYKLLSHDDIFSIDPSSGVIRSLVPFDRENINVYHVKVKAYDNSPSALKKTKEPNEAVQTFEITIEDRNDNKPKFTHSVYNCTDILESTDRGKDVGEVKAVDKDTASLITYSIIEGNVDDAFYIENTTGRIKVNKELDFEKIEMYVLKVRAFDGIFEDTAKVVISIANVNDEIPVFEEHNKTVKIREETIPDDCIVRVVAYDPDIKDRTANQHIVYNVDNTQSDFLKVTTDGCVLLIKPLDRDKPFGSPTRQAFIYAYDNDGGPNAMNAYSEIMIELEDINDNAPFLNVTEIVWYENQDPGRIGELSADDYDGPDNGPPFIFELAMTASIDIVERFKIEGQTLYALVTFDREEKKYYDIPISITDSGRPPLTSISVLRVIIGDRNDNPASDGSSEIFVYKYQGLESDIAIGRVFVEDLDDWDLPDKVFIQLDNFDNFRLSDEDRGMIIMSSVTREGEYFLRFNVTEEHLPNILFHAVNANVTVTVKEIPEEAVVKSGSVRIAGSTIEEFVAKSATNGKSRKDVLHQRIAEIVNTSISNVDVFTVLTSPSNNSLIDVRFSAHGSPYYAAEKLNNKITNNQEKLESELGVEFVMISINECVNESRCALGSSCSNQLNIHDEPAVVFTNRTSFVGVKAIVDTVCDCIPRLVRECFNGGYFGENGICVCPSEFEGPHCERLSIGFNRDGWALYPTLDACNKTVITLTVSPTSDNGLIFYAGPLTFKHAQLSKDFISLELKDGIALLKVDNGYGTEEVSIPKKLNDGAQHKIRISLDIDTDIEMEIDDCKSHCTALQPFKQKGLLNIYGPLQVGGMSKVFTDEEAKIIWSQSAPTSEGFAGCIKNFSFNDFLYNLGDPSDEYHSFVGCNYATQQAVTFGIDSNFLVAILVCLAVLFFLLLAVVVHRRQQDNLNEKDIDDTTENIINYEDEGGGECDTNYDLSVFHKNLEEKPIMKGLGDVPADISDISGFLDTKKDSCDKDPDNLPYDDVRHYAYEGDGNSTGSLSSLGSCTDDGDLDFNYLSSFGKRFSKLADMYDYDGSDDDTQNGGDEAWF